MKSITLPKAALPKTAAGRIRLRVQENPLGTLFLVRDFLDIGTAETIVRTLSRLTQEGILRRVGHGIYESPRMSALLGKPVPPRPEEIAAAMARRVGAEIVPAEAQIANALHLTTQVPAKSIFRINSGKVRRARVGNHTVELRPAAARNFSKNQSESVIQGLRFVGEENITGEMVEQLRRTLSSEHKVALLHKLPDAPAWMHPYLRRIVEDEEAEGAE